MIGISDIYDWDKSWPTWDKTLQNTPLQRIEFYERESTQEFFANKEKRSFIGEYLSLSPLRVSKIGKDKITGYAEYCSGNDGKPLSERKRWYDTGLTDTFVTKELMISYDIGFGEKLYGEVRLIQDHSMVEVEGEITKFEATYYKEGYGESEYSVRQYGIGLNLSAIKVIRGQRLYIDEIKDRTKAIDNANLENLNESVGKGVLGGIYGALIGIVIGIVLVFFLQIGSWIVTGKEQTPYDTFVLLLPALILGFLGSKFFYKDKRDEIK